MEKWSSTVADPFHVKFDLDTNILVYLVDKTYPSLTELISLIQNSPFAYEVTVSNFVLYEFIGIRKREHFLRQVLAKSQSQNGEINLSSLLKFKDSFSTPELDYFEASQEIIKSIDDEISILTNNTGITINQIPLNNNIFLSTKDLFLNSKISKEDTLVLISSISPNLGEGDGFLCFITNDTGFIDAFHEQKFKDKIDEVLKNHTLTKPYIESIGKQDKNLTGLNLKSVQGEIDIHSVFLKLLKQLIIYKNRSIYVGKTFNNNCSNKPNIVCIDIDTECEINLATPPILTIISKNLDFIFNTPVIITEFRNKNGVTIQFPFSKESFEEHKLSFAFPNLEDEDENKIYENEILIAIKQTGNLVFVHPDSFD